MRVRLLLLGGLLLAAPAIPRADVAGLVDPHLLPEQARKAWAEVAAQERWAATWAPEWAHPVQKARVAEALEAGLATLHRASEAQPGNRELLLAVGLAGRFAHNLDVKGAPEAGIAALRRAAEGAGDDPRPAWFLGTSLCQTEAEVIEGAELLRAVAARTAAARLPAAFLQELLSCAIATAMPAHAVGAARELERRGELDDGGRRMLARQAELLLEPDPAKEIPRDQAWSLLGAGGERRVACRPCGFSSWLGEDWRASQGKNGTCLLSGPVGPFPGKTGKVYPNILVLARPAQEGETLDAFLASMGKLAKSVPAVVQPCPSAPCLAREVDLPGNYQPEGGALALAVAFGRDEPEVRGRALERPSRPPATAGGGAQTFRVQPRYLRFPGKVYYLVLLDSARSVEEPARAEYRRFLSALVLE